MLVGELIERVQSLYSKGVASDDSRLSSRHIYHKLKTVRLKLISQQIKKKQKISDWSFIVLPCVEIIKVSASECTCFTAIDNCFIYRTKFSLPKVMTSMDKHLIEYVMSVDGSIKFEELDKKTITYNKGNKYTKEKPKYSLENGYFYFKGGNVPGVVKIKLLAEDPIKAQEFPSACKEEDSNCADCKDCSDCVDYPSMEFPIDGDLVDTLIEMSLAELLEIFSKNLEDRTSNSADANAEGTK